MGKKLLSMVLALVLALGVAVCGGAEGERTGDLQEELHTLWNIPFGCAPDEAIELAKKNAGVFLYKEYGSSGQCVKLVQGQQIINVLGWEIDKVILWIRDNKYKHGVIHYSFPPSKEYKMLAWFAGNHIKDIYDKLTTLYGQYSDAIAYKSDPNTKDISLIFYWFPDDQGKLDDRLIMQMLEENQDMLFEVTWSNVHWWVGMDTNSKGQKVIRWHLYFYGDPLNDEKVDENKMRYYPKQEGYLTYEEAILLEEEKANRTGPEVYVGL